MIMIYTSIATIINVGYNRPCAEGSPANRMKILNEVTVLLITYTMMCQTDFVPDDDIKFGIGYVSCAILVAHTLANLGLLLI
jgi:hypothetical protein